MSDKEFIYESTNMDLLGSALGEAKAGKLTIDDLISAWFNSKTIEEFDAAVNGASTLKILIGKK